MEHPTGMPVVPVYPARRYLSSIPLPAGRQAFSDIPPSSFLPQKAAHLRNTY